MENISARILPPFFWAFPGFAQRGARACVSEIKRWYRNFLDNEGGLGNNPSQGYWQYPNQVKYGSTQTVAAYQQQYYLRGQRLMAAIIAQWLSCKFIYAHTEAESDPNEPMTSPSGAEPAVDYV
jgi:hypothetical protein